MTAIVLASGSPIRRSVLTAAGFALHVQPAQIDEVLPDNAPAQDAAIALALAKAWDVAGRLPRAIVVGADQVMEQSGELLAKAESRAAARRRLRAMSGRWHRFFPAAAVVGPRVEEIASQTVAVRFRSLTDREIEAYLDTGEWRGCVGCYQIENQGIHLVDRVDGDLNAVLGLPLLPLLKVLRRVGVGPLGPP